MLKLTLETLPSPLGPMLLVTDAADIVRALEWERDAERMHRLMQRQYPNQEVDLIVTASLSRHRKSIEAYFDGDITALNNIETKTGGTAFQQQVWAELKKIPCGTTIAYKELARRVGTPKGMQAVGMANGANPIAIIIPCHRVIGADGSLTGYAGGLHRKEWLLSHERALPPQQATLF